MINKLHGVKFLLSKKGYMKLAEQIKAYYRSLDDENFVPSHLWPTSRDNWNK